MSHTHHLARAPFSIEVFSSGLAIILDANGINWGRQEGGAVMFKSESAAREWAVVRQLEIVNEKARPSA